MLGIDNDNLEFRITTAYFTGGIWNALKCLCAGLEAESWIVVVPAGGLSICVQKYGADPPLWHESEEPVALAEANVILDVFGPGGALAFRVALQVSRVLPDRVCESVSRLLGLFLLYEAKDTPCRMPSLFCRLPPLSGDLSEINAFEALPATVFLCGKRFTGRKTFVEARLREIYGSSLNLQALLEGQNVFLDEAGRYSVVAEVALLGLQEQRMLADRSDESPAFLISEYDPEVLIQEGLLDQSLFDCCRGAVLRFRSKRTDSFFTVRNIYKNFRGLDVSVANETREGGFYAPLKSVGRAQYVGSKPADVQGLRSMVRDLEVRAIHEAYSLVGNSQNKIADHLGISRGSLQHKIRKYNLPYSEWDDA